MKHHNKFRVEGPNAEGYFAIKFAELGSVSGHASRISSNDIKINAVTLEMLLNSLYDSAWEDGRRAVLSAMKEAMGFDGE